MRKKRGRPPKLRNDVVFLPSLLWMGISRRSGLLQGGVSMEEKNSNKHLLRDKFEKLVTDHSWKILGLYDAGLGKTRKCGFCGQYSRYYAEIKRDDGLCLMVSKKCLLRPGLKISLEGTETWFELMDYKKSTGRGRGRKRSHEMPVLVPGERLGRALKQKMGRLGQKLGKLKLEPPRKKTKEEIEEALRILEETE